jgi:hypothetical protein
MSALDLRILAAANLPDTANLLFLEEIRESAITLLVTVGKTRRKH